MSATTPVTLAAIEARQNELAAMIEAIKAATPTTYGIPETTIELKPGEHYAGLMLDDEGEPSHHLILLPGQADDITWNAAIDWATQAGGELPTRREQSLLFANLKQHFEERYYWSAEPVAGNESYAWCQGFSYGGQSSGHKSIELRARAVRRVAI